MSRLISDELAKEIAEALATVTRSDAAYLGGSQEEIARIYTRMRNSQIGSLMGTILPILRPHIERHERLREAAINAGVVILESEDYAMMSPYMEHADEQDRREKLLSSLRTNLDALRTALDEETKG